jgi:hypothetical protein
MHLNNFMHLNIEQFLWAMVLAAHFLLLIVLMGRERAARFRWFTAWVALAAIILVANHMLHGKLTTVAFYWQTYSALAIESILGIMVLIELARKIFSSGRSGLILKANGWIGWTMVTVAIAIAAVWAWGPWPTRAALQAEKDQLPLLIVILIGMKGQLLVSILIVEAALLFRTFGSRFGFGWRSHAQQIALGLSTNALAFLAAQGITDAISHAAHPKSRLEYDHLVHLVTNIENGRTVVWFLALVWCIVWLWRDEPGSPEQLAGAGVPAGTGPLSSKAGAANPLPLAEDGAGQ